MMDELRYKPLVDHYETCLEQHGAIPKGVDWPNARDLSTRFNVMLDISRNHHPRHPMALLDLGCGYGALLDHINALQQIKRFTYHGIDMSPKMIQAAINRHPNHFFEERNILTNPLSSSSVDYVLMNGLFTEKRSLTQAEMTQFFIKMVQNSFKASRIGIAFNVMSTHVDWMRDDLYHLPFDEMVSILHKHCSRHLTIRSDYGLYEYTVYVYQHANC